MSSLASIRSLRQRRAIAPEPGDAPRTNITAVSILIANSVLTSTAFFMLFPLLSVRFSTQLGFAASLVGIALAVRILCQQGLTVFGGAIADQTGYKPMIAMGMVVRGLGFFVWAFAETAPLLFLGAALSGLGGMMFDAPSRAGIATFTAPGIARRRAFTMSNMAGNVGSTFGPLLGVWLLQFDFRTVGIISGTVFLLISLQTLLFLPNHRQASQQKVQIRETLQSIGSVMRDARFVRFTSALVAYWFLYNQLFVAVPLAAVARTGDTASTGVIYALSAGLGIVLQYPMAQLAARYLSPFVAIAGGLVCMAVGLTAFGLVPTFSLMLVCIAVYGMGKMIVDPIQLNLISEIAPPHRMGAYIGFSQLAFAIGGSLGNAIDGALYDLSLELALPWLVWLIMGVIGILGAIAVLIIGRGFSTVSHRP